MAHDVFISYSSKDKTVADAICAPLESRKICCWIAPRDVPPGKPYAASLVNAIRESRVIVLVLSKGSNNSVHVLREVSEAVDNGIPIIPFRIEDSEPSEEMRYYIKSIHWLDAMSPPLERHLGALTESVQALLSVGEDQPSVPAASQVDIHTNERRAFLIWAIAMIILVVVLVTAGVGGWAYTWWLTASSQPQIADQSVAVEQESTPINNQTPEPSSPAAGSEWRTLNFNIPNESLWSLSEEGSYTALNQTANTAFAWSDEIIEGDFILNVNITNPDEPAEGVISIYGDGWDYSYGELLFSPGMRWLRIIEM